MNQLMTAQVIRRKTIIMYAVIEERTLTAEMALNLVENASEIRRTGPLEAASCGCVH